MNRKILKIFFPNYYGDIENIFIQIICYLQHNIYIYIYIYIYIIIDILDNIENAPYFYNYNTFVMKSKHISCMPQLDANMIGP